MKSVMTFLFLLVVFIACEDEDQTSSVSIKPGTYKGHFSRTSPTGDYPASSVTLEFTSDRFSGQSDMMNYPAICSGKFSVEGNEIIFNNECFYTANFDWTLILNGNYQFQLSGTRLVLTRTQNEVTDKYDLAIQ